MKTAMYRSPFLLLLFLLLQSCNQELLRLQLDIQPGPPQVMHGMEQLREIQKDHAIQFTDRDPDLMVRAKIDSVNIPKEGFCISVKDQVVEISGGDATGVMYGLLELKEQLVHDLSVTNTCEEPHLAFRAIKYNLPWDSYRHSEALSLHYETCRDTTYWEAFLNMMAENRFNKLTLWNLHPFNYLVRTEKYPEACGFSDQELAEWQEFWHTLFKMAKDRGIETYLVHWNIFVSPEFAEAHNVATYCLTYEHNVEQGDTSEIIKDYTRESVKAVIDTYPNLTGLGITLGEGMGGMTAEEREQWLFDSYIEGMRMASREIKFIHRVPLSAGTGSGGSTSMSVEKMTRAAIDTLTIVEGPVNIELKFNWSHAFSSPHLVKVHGGELTDAYWNPMPENYYLAWMMRNEDFFMLRWGQPDFIRKHLALNVHPYVNGYYVGSECYIPAKDYITALDGASYRYAFDRQWMFYRVIGRLLYNPETPDRIFTDAFEARFPGYGETLFSAQTKASRVPLIIGSYQNATWDFSLYSEGLLSVTREDGKRYLRLIPLTKMASQDPLDPFYMSISEFLATETDPEQEMINPVQLADSLDSFCLQAIDETKEISIGDNVDLRYEVSDIQAWANLGMYFSNKLRAAVEYSRFLSSGNPEDLDRAIHFLETAVQYWLTLVEVTEPVYDPVPLVHYYRNNVEEEIFHWSLIEDEVVKELDWLKSLRTN